MKTILRFLARNYYRLISVVTGGHAHCRQCGWRLRTDEEFETGLCGDRHECWQRWSGNLG